MLYQEAAILSQLQPSGAVCRLVYRPREADDRGVWVDGGGVERGSQPPFIAMSLLLCDLSELRKGGDLSRPAMWEAFLLMLRAMRRCHEGRILHRDVKPSNFGLAWGEGGEGGKVLTCYILDFGQSTSAFDPKGSPHCPASFKGKSYFASIARLEGRKQGRSDDLIMLAYIFHDFLCTSLPWKSAHDRRQSMADRGREEILQAKKAFSQSPPPDADPRLMEMLRRLEGVEPEDEPHTMHWRSW